MSWYKTNLHSRRFVFKLFTLLLLAAPALGVVECRGACQACRAGERPSEVLDIYCAMCHECRERRKEQLKNKNDALRKRRTTQSAGDMLSLRAGKSAKLESSDDDYLTYEQSAPGDCSRKKTIRSDEPLRSRIIVEIPEGCPTPPPCSDDEEVYYIRSSTRPPTTTQQPALCPPIRPCKKKTTPQPCVPWCLPPFSPYPHQGMCTCTPGTPVTAPVTTLPTTQSTPTTSEIQFMNVYVGIPKNVLRRNRFIG